MENNLIKFKSILKENKENRVYNESIVSNSNANPYYSWYNCKTTYSFYLNTYRHSPGWVGIGQRGMDLIKLDEEDIQYFANKYLPKLQEEMESKINKIKEEYEK